MDLESRYQFLDKVGAGSFATVYRARDLELGREVAIKKIHEQYLEDPAQLDRYWQEAQLLASLHHPNIVTIFDIYRDRGWLILELMQTNLAERMTGRQMDVRAVRTTLAHCLRALRHLHERGVLHGDVKPGNMMIDARRRVKLGDFGLARRVSDEEGSLLKGTTKYMAPEVVSDEFGAVGPSSDLYSLGFAAYELICGPNFEQLFPGLSAFGRNKQVAWMMWHAAADRRLPPIHRVLQGVPDDVARVVDRLCEKDPAKRYPSAEAALADLNVDLRVIHADDATHDGGEAPAGKRDNKRLLVAAVAFALSLVMSVLMLFMTGESVTTEPKTEFGVVSAIFPERNSLRVEGLEDGIPEELNVGGRPRIYLENEGRNILLRELQAGDRVQIERDVDDAGQPIVSLRAARPVETAGRIRSVDLGALRVVIGIEEGETRDDLPLRVPERAQIMVNGARGQLRDVRVDDRVVVSHLTDTKDRLERVVDTLTVLRAQEAPGFVESYDPKTQQLTINFGPEGSAGKMSRIVAEDAEIRAEGGGDVTLEQLAAGDRIRFTYDTEIRSIIVSRTKNRVAGAVREVRPESKEIAMTSTTGAQLVFRTTNKTEVMLNLAPADLDALREFDAVEVSFDESESEPRPAVTIDAKRPTRADRYALVIGVSRTNDSYVSALPEATINAGLIRDVLVQRYSFDSGRVHMLLDPTREEIEKTLADILQSARSQTQVIVYVSAQAYKGDDDRYYIAPRDFNWDQKSETGLAIGRLVELLDASAAKDKMILLDTAHTGTGPDMQFQASAAEMVTALESPPQSTAIIASTSEGQRGRGWMNAPQSAFAHVLAEGFRGSADADRDLRITAQEMQDFLASAFSEVELVGGGKQTPKLFAP